MYGSLEPDPDPPRLPKDLAPADLLANLNYARPSFFGREFLGVVVELAVALDLRVVDPQDDEIGGAAKPKHPVAEELIAVWDIGNAKSVGAARSQGVRLPVMSRGDALEWWSYMHARGDYQAQLGEAAHAPELRLVRRWETDRVLRLSTWVEGNPALFPRCDLVALLRPHATKQFERSAALSTTARS